MKPENLLELQDVRTHFPLTKGTLFPRLTGHVKAVDGVTLDLKRGEVLGLVGESGCGKSTLGRTIIKLIRATSGQISLSHEAQGGVQMIFQDPYSSLNPRMTVFDTLAEPMLVNGFATRATVAVKVAELMHTVGLAPRFMRKYPHEFSGGQRQRIAIARALALKPRILIADEPVSALDVSIQAQILNLLASLRKRLGLSIIFISHDLSVIRHLSDRVAVMYLGKIVELGSTAEIFAKPQHPYTRALLSAIPLPDPDLERNRERVILAGDAPSPINPPSGCAFHPRCAYATFQCSQRQPVLARQGTSETRVACINL
ncbi:MAG: ATP-binding cassette domain-containing protein [Deltaproteobacteria bacterium]|nr:ATP-binding cassette domain-containing protein [Deltaproteobacteria bacterium]